MSTPETPSPCTLPHGALKHYHDLLNQGQFQIQHCPTCQAFVFFPREVCPSCGHNHLDWVTPSGLGTVYSSTTIHRKADAGGNYNLALIELDEGVRMMSRIEGLNADQVRIGLRVKARVHKQGEAPALVVFDAIPDALASPPPAPPNPSSTKALQAPAIKTFADPLHALRGKVAIAGVATAGCGEAHGYSEMELLAQAAHAAVSNAGLRMSDIDGICTASVSATMWPMPVIEYLGLNPRYIDGTMLGGSSFIAHLLPAIQALNSGQCNAVLVCYGSTQRTAQFGRKEIGAARKWLDPQPFEMPYDPVMPVTAYALAAARHMHQFGTTRRDLAEVAVAARAWAQLNPQAFMRDPLSIEDVLQARMVCEPLSVRDCCLVTDGAGAYVLVRSDHARDLAQEPVYVLGNGTAVWHRQISCMQDLTTTAAAQSGQQAYAMAKISPKEVDVVELYDAFTINTLLFLEDLGFCGKGESAAFVRHGGIAPGGHLPVNTNGGGLSCTHPGMYGIFALIEAVQQLRQEAGARQVKNAHIALAHGNGGTLSSQSTAILGTAHAL